MLDGVSLDQLRTFIAAVEEGSLSAASRKLLRAQSAVSQSVSTLEEQTGVALFDRAGRYPKLTAGGRVPLSDARAAVSSVDVLKARAKGMASGLSAGREFGVMSPLGWRLSDLFAKRAFLLNGLGWGGMPAHTVRQDIAKGRLAAPEIEDRPEGAMILPMAAVCRTAAPPGPAGRWFIARLRSLARAGALVLACAALVPGPAAAQAADPPAPPAFPVPGTPAPAEAPAPGSVTLDHPRVVDTGRLKGSGRTAALFGVTGADDAGHRMQAAIQAKGDRVSCEPHAAGGFTCTLPDGTDAAIIPLANGTARATDEATDAYRAVEAAAQAARRGIWATLPPPPAVLAHPVARTSALVAAGSRSYPLDGLQGFAGKPAQDMQAYIVAHGDRLACQQQGAEQRFVCTLPDGSDLGQAALARGAARAAALCAL